MSRSFLEFTNKTGKSLDQFLQQAWQARQAFRLPVFETVYPAKTLPVSVTGNRCALQCAHCGGKYLEHMVVLDRLGTILKKGFTGILLSGGCDLSGRVPLTASISQVREQIIKSGRSIAINVHPGILNEQEAQEIADFATVISFDFVIDDVTIQKAFGNDRTGRDYINTLRYLRKGKAKVVPHILVGLYKGQIRGEYQAVDFLIREGIEHIIFIVFIPTPGTKWEHLLPPKIEEVLRLLAWTRIQKPQIKISLGCMRPKGKYSAQLDLLAIKAGIDAIVLPHFRAINEARRKGLKIYKKEECCAFD